MPRPEFDPQVPGYGPLYGAPLSPMPTTNRLVVNFLPFEYLLLSDMRMCGLCGAVVTVDSEQRHRDWHTHINHC